MSFSEQELRTALAPLKGDPQAIAARVLAALPDLPPEAAPAPRPAGRWPWLWIAAAGVLGFGFGYALRREAPPQVTPPTQAAGLPQVTALLGDVEAFAPETKGSDVLANGAEFRFGTYLNTGAFSKLAVRISPELELRLDERSGVQVEAANDLRLKEGQLWLAVRAAAPVRLRAAHATSIEATRGVLVARSGAEGVRLTVLEGSATILAGGQQLTLAAGQTATARDGKLDAAQQLESVATVTDWLLELQVLAGDRKELEKRVERLLIDLGRAKLDTLADFEIRKLGNHCAEPLAAFLRRADVAKEQRLRRRASLLLADVADIRSLPRLFELLHDVDPEVRVAIARGIARLCGIDPGVEIGFWRSGEPDERKKMAASWREMALR